MFYHIEITANAQAIYAHANLEEAVAAFHYALWYAQNSGSESMTAMVIDANGAVYRSEKFVKTAEPEEE